MTERDRQGSALARPGADAREAAVARLSSAFAHDVLSMDEFERRTAAVYRAESAAELAQLVADLPAPAQAPTGFPVMQAMPARLAVAFSNVERGGVTLVPPRLEIRAVFGNVELDLREARFGPGVTEISVQAVFGNVEIRLPPGMRVENHGAATLGSFTTRTTPGTPSDVQLLVTGRAVLANVALADDRDPL